MKAMGIEETSEDWEFVGNFLKSKAKVQEANWVQLADQKLFDELTEGANLGSWKGSLRQTIQKMLNPPAGTIRFCCANLTCCSKSGSRGLTSQRFVQTR